MGFKHRGVVDVVLVDDEPDAPTGGLFAGLDGAGTLVPQDPPRDRQSGWQRGARRWWPVAGGLALALVATSVVADHREGDRMAALAGVPGVLAPLGNTIAEKWRAGDAKYSVLGTTTDLLVGTLERADGSGAVVGIDATTGNSTWEVATRPAGAATHTTQCAAPTRPTAEEADSSVVVCVLVDEIENPALAVVGESNLARKARLLVVDATEGIVLADEPIDPSAMVTFAGADLVIGQVRSDGRYQVSRKSAWDTPARWTFTTLDRLGADEFGRRSASIFISGDLVQIESWSMSSGGGARSSWVLAEDGSALRSPTAIGSAGYGAGFAVLHHNWLLTESGVTSDSSYSTLTDLTTGSSFRVDARPFDALPDDGSLDDLILAQSPPGDDLIAYDLAAGQPRWTVPNTGGTVAMVIEGRVIRAEAGRLVSIDGHTGQTLWSTPIDMSNAAPDQSTPSTEKPSESTYSYVSASASIFTDGQVVLVANSDPARLLQIAAYTLNDGRKLWTRTLPRETRLDEVDGELYGLSEHDLLALG